MSWGEFIVRMWGLGIGVFFCYCGVGIIREGSCERLGFGVVFLGWFLTCAVLFLGVR